MALKKKKKRAQGEAGESILEKALVVQGTHHEAFSAKKTQIIPFFHWNIKKNTRFVFCLFRSFFCSIFLRTAISLARVSAGSIPLLCD